jgi:hypothetical protein
MAVLLHNDDKGYDIIGEAALRLALVRKEITVISLYSMLEHMAKEFDKERRLSELREARRWLSEFLRSGHQNESGKIYLQTLGSLNEEQN